MISKIHPKAEIEKITIKPGIRALNAAAILLGTESVSYTHLANNNPMLCLQGNCLLGQLQRKIG